MIPTLWVAAGLGAVIALFMLSAGASGSAGRQLLGAAFGVLAMQMALAALQIGAGPMPPVWLRPMLAMLLGPLFYLHLATGRRAVERPEPRDALHLLGPALLAAIWSLMGSGPWIDGVILGSFVAYAALIWRLGPSITPALDLWRRCILAFLVVAAVCDLAVVLELSHLSSLSGSIAFGASILLITGFCVWTLLASLHRSAPMAWLTERRSRRSPAPAGMVEHLESWMDETRAYLDPNLTVSKLARRIGHPTRIVSNAVNTIEPLGFARWLNGYRIRYAQALMAGTPNGNLLDILLASGFQSKSTFNAAFKTATGLTPTEWRGRAALRERAEDPLAKARGHPG